jgi:hypothetical protein
MYMPESVRSNEEFCFEFVRNDGLALEYCSDEIKKNKDIVV